MNYSNWASTKSAILKAFLLNMSDEDDPIRFFIESDVSTFEFVTEGALISIVGTLGVIANLVSLVILGRPQMRSSINCGLQGLAVFDTVSVWSVFVWNREKLIEIYQGQLVRYSQCSRDSPNDWQLIELRCGS